MTHLLLFLMEQLKGSLKTRIQFKERTTSIIRDVIHVFCNRSGSHFWVRCIYISCICLIVGLTWSLYLIHIFQEARIPGTTQLSRVPTMRRFNVKRKHVLSFPENCNRSVLFHHA